jgi:hypothetical protein
MLINNDQVEYEIVPDNGLKADLDPEEIVFSAKIVKTHKLGFS